MDGRRFQVDTIWGLYTCNDWSLNLDNHLCWLGRSVLEITRTSVDWEGFFCDNGQLERQFISIELFGMWRQDETGRAFEKGVPITLGDWVGT